MTVMESVRRMVRNFDEAAVDPYIIPVGVNYTVQLYVVVVVVAVDL